MTSQTVEAGEDLRRANLEIAEAIAPGWERRRPFIEESVAPVREWLVRELRPRRGDTVLELAAGAGDTGFEAARLLGADGRLISSDFSPAMLDVARRRGRELGVEDVDHRLLDAERIALEADGPIGLALRRLPQDERRALRADVERAFAPFATHAGYELPGVALCAVAS